VLPVHAEFAVVAIHHGRKQDSSTGLEVRDVFAAFENVSGNIAARNLRERNAGDSFSDEKIQMIERDGLDADEHLVFTEHWIWNVFVFQNFGSTMLMESDGFHCIPRKKDTLPRSVNAGSMARRRILTTSMEGTMSAQAGTYLRHELVTTAFEIDGYEVVRNLGVVRGIVVRSRSIFGTIGAGLQTIIGGNITILTDLCEQTRQHAFELMVQHANQLGANAVIGFRYDATEIMQGVTEVLAYGTAVILKEKQS
jgi:uncharacterized protein YbjQ (UPF0145 family)